MQQIISNILLGWIPDWVWVIVNLWPYLGGAALLVGAISLLYRVYQLGGWPGLSAALGALGIAIGYWLGRKSNKPVPKPEKRRTTIVHHRPSILKSLLEDEK